MVWSLPIDGLVVGDATTRLPALGRCPGTAGVLAELAERSVSLTDPALTTPRVPHFFFTRSRMSIYHGSCHCQAVQFTVETDLTKTLECNCSHCSRKGFLLTFVPDGTFHLLSGEDQLTEYRFNKKVIAHLFCKTCGVQCFGRGVDEKGNATVAVNVRCLEGVDPRALKPTFFDGKSW